MNEASTIGARLKRIRTERGLSQEHLAERSGLSRALIAKLENGARQTARLTSLMRLATALDVELSALTDTRDRMRAHDGPTGGVRALRDALVSPGYLPGLAQDEDGEPTSVRDLRRAVDASCRAYWDGDFGGLLAQLPGLLAEARHTHTELGADAVPPLAMAYDLAASVLVHLGRDDLAALAAERSITIAHQGNDELLWATLHSTFVWILQRQARLREAEELATRTAALVEPSYSAPPAHVAAWGRLLSTAIAPAAAAGRASEVAEYISLATAAAGRVGQRLPVYASHFGPGSVVMQATYAYAVLQEPGRALEQARRIRPGDLSGISYGRHLLDVAQAHVAARHHRAAAERLGEAQRGAPTWFRHQALAHELVGAVRVAETRPSSTVRSLTRALGI